MHVFDLADARHLSRVRRRRNDQRYGGAGCTWTASSNSPWITITGASGTRTGTVTYTVAQYVGKPKKRNGSMTVAGQNSHDPAVEVIVRQRTARQ